MKSILPYIQIFTSVFLIAAILLQQKGTGLSATFGGEGNIYRTKRGVEKMLFYSTIGLAAVFFLAATINIVL